MDKKNMIREYIIQNMIIFDDDIVLEDSDNIFKKGFVNSLFAMKLLNFVETKFDIRIKDEDIEIANFSSVDRIMEFVNKKKDAEE